MLLHRFKFAIQLWNIIGGDLTPVISGTNCILNKSVSGDAYELVREVVEVYKQAQWNKRVPAVTGEHIGKIVSHGS